MANMQSKIRNIPDALLFLQTEAAAAVTATGASENVLSLDQLSAYWNTDGVSNDLGWNQQVVIQLMVTALDFTTMDETYEFELQVDSVDDFSDSPVTVGSVVVTATGQYELTVSRAIIEEMDPDAAYLRLNAVLAGTTPSITYNAYAGPLLGW